MWGRAIPRRAKWKERTLLAVCAAILSAGMADSGKIYISLDRSPGGATDDSPTPFLDNHNGNVHAPAAWTQGLNGSGIGVAVTGRANTAGGKWAAVPTGDFDPA